MSVKWNIQGGLIYAAMLLYALSLAAWIVRSRRAGVVLYAIGFLAAAGSVVYRALHVGHAPLQNLFEVFLVLGMLVFPLSVFCRRLLGVGGEAVDAAMGLALLAAAGFFLSDRPLHLPPLLRSSLFVPHVAAYMAAYVILAKAGTLAAALLVRGDGGALGQAGCRYEAVSRMVRLGFPFMTTALLLGAVWGKQAWGDYWNWDPKELWSLAAWLVFAAYLHFRSMHGRRYPRVAAGIAVLGLLLIAVTLLWANLAGIFAGLHSYA